MFSFFVHAVGERSFRARSISARGAPYAIDGEYENRPDSAIEYTFCWTYGRYPNSTTVYRGQLTADGQSMFGVWGASTDELLHDFYFTRLSPELLTTRPSPAEFRRNKIRALWEYAISTIRKQVQQRTTGVSWDRIKDYIERRNRFLDLCQRNEESGLLVEERRVLHEYMGGFTFDEVSCCFVLMQLRQRPATQS